MASAHEVAVHSINWNIIGSVSSEMREPTFWILTSLANGPQHGYAVLEAIDALSSGTMTLKVATVYAALDRLTREGLIEVDHEEAVHGRMRRYFRLTPHGLEQLRGAIERRELQARRARTQLNTPPAGALG